LQLLVNILAKKGWVLETLGERLVNGRGRFRMISINPNSYGFLFSKLSHSFFSLAGALLLVVVLGGGLIVSYQDHLKMVRIKRSIQPLASGVTYPLPPRSDIILYLSNMIPSEEDRPIVVEVGEWSPQALLIQEELTEEYPIPISSQGAELIGKGKRPSARTLITSAALKSHSRLDQPDRLLPYSDDLLQERVRAGLSWMDSSKMGYSIQIMLVSKVTISPLDEYLQGSGLTPFQDDLYLFPLKGRRYLLYYGLFNQDKEARFSIKRLPKLIVESGAFVLPLHKIREKVARQQSKP
jgi:hypothetical protein